MKIKHTVLSCVLSFSWMLSLQELYPASAPVVELAANGCAVAAWIVSFGSDIAIQANVRSAGSWQNCRLLSPCETDNIDAPKIAITPKGDDISAVMIWSQKNTKGGMVLFASVFPSLFASWTDPVQISKDDGNITSSAEYSVRMDEKGNALAIWSSVDPSGKTSIYSSFLNLAHSMQWETPKQISAP